MPPVLYLFALCNLVIGSGAFVLGGILVPLAGSLGISVAAAGQAMTAYAVATAVLAPLLIVATARWSRKSVIQLALGIFAVGCLICALANNLTALLLGRALMGAGAMFSAAASALAVALVAPAQRGRALSITFLGMSISYAVGVPVGAWLGFEYGWRVPVWLSVAASLQRCQLFRFRRGGAARRGAAGLAAHLAVLHRHLQCVCLHRASIAGTEPDDFHTTVHHAGGVRPGRGGRHLVGRLGQ